MRLLFLHGLQGSPNGRKATALRDAGHDVIAPALPRDDFVTAVRLAARTLEDAIKVIRPYKWQGTWVFDNPAVGLDKEALVAGMPELIEMATAKAGIHEAEKGFVALFSKDPFPTAQLYLEHVREDFGGNVYRWPGANREGWLCPALFRYFERAPERLYIEVRVAEDNESEVAS